MSRTLAQRTAVAPSGTLAVTQAVRALRAQGVDVVDLGGGDPDFPTPPHLVAAAERALARGETHYVDAWGLPELREAIAAKLRRENGLALSADEVLVTPGAKAGIFAAIQALVEPGVDVLLPEPAWVSYRPMVEAAGGRVAAVPLSASDGYTLTRAALEAALTQRCRLLIVNSPTNPTGRVLRAEELEAVAQVAVAHDLVVLADEIYEHLVYDGRAHVSLATLPGMAGRTLTVNGFSKTWAMTGWRLGYVAGGRALLSPIALLHAHMVTCAASFTQAAGVAALEGPLAPMREMVARWDARRRRLCAALGEVPGLRVATPEGTFYAFVDVRGSGLGSTEAARRLLHEAHVAVTPGEAFGEAGAGRVRLSFATSDAELERGLERVASFFRAVSRGSVAQEQEAGK